MLHRFRNSLNVSSQLYVVFPIEVDDGLTTIDKLPNLASELEQLSFIWPTVRSLRQFCVTRILFVDSILSEAADMLAGIALDAVDTTKSQLTHIGTAKAKLSNFICNHLDCMAAIDTAADGKMKEWTFTWMRRCLTLRKLHGQTTVEFDAEKHKKES